MSHRSSTPVAASVGVFATANIAWGRNDLPIGVFDIQTGEKWSFVMVPTLATASLLQLHQSLGAWAMEVKLALLGRLGKKAVADKLLALDIAPQPLSQTDISQWRWLRHLAKEEMQAIVAGDYPAADIPFHWAFAEELLGKAIGVRHRVPSYTITDAGVADAELNEVDQRLRASLRKQALHYIHTTFQIEEAIETVPRTNEPSSATRRQELTEDLERTCLDAESLLYQARHIGWDISTKDLNSEHDPQAAGAAVPRTASTSARTTSNADAQIERSSVAPIYETSSQSTPIHPLSQQKAGVSSTPNLDKGRPVIPKERDEDTHGTPAAPSTSVRVPDSDDESVVDIEETTYETSLGRHVCDTLSNRPDVSPSRSSPPAPTQLAPEEDAMVTHLHAPSGNSLHATDTLVRISNLEPTAVAISAISHYESDSQGTAVDQLSQNTVQPAQNGSHLHTQHSASYRDTDDNLRRSRKAVVFAPVQFPESDEESDEPEHYAAQRREIRATKISLHLVSKDNHGASPPNPDAARPHRSPSHEPAPTAARNLVLTSPNSPTPPPATAEALAGSSASQATAVNPLDQDAGPSPSLPKGSQFYKTQPKAVLPKESDHDLPDIVTGPSASAPVVEPDDEIEEVPGAEDLAPAGAPVRRNPRRRATSRQPDHATTSTARPPSVPPRPARVQASRKTLVEVVISQSKLSKRSNLLEPAGPSKGTKRKGRSDDEAEEPTAAPVIGRQSKRLRRNTTPEEAAQPDIEIIEPEARPVPRRVPKPRRLAPVPRPVRTVQKKHAEAVNDVVELDSGDESTDEHPPLQPMAGPGPKSGKLSARLRSESTVSQVLVQAAEEVITIDSDDEVVHDHPPLRTAIRRDALPARLPDVDEEMDEEMDEVREAISGATIDISDEEDVEIAPPSSPKGRHGRTTRGMSVAGKKVNDKDMKKVTNTALKKMTVKAKEAIEKRKAKDGEGRKMTTRRKGNANEKKIAR
ncbi:hypothetical protein CALCODRAFT_559071 [Calocera cornea HHB12733]|uniref:Uncharacterized protein n=1 Tax=Calocera cornea HHB12733 TaxID=1353952 RepID=A0A165CBH3_9BASI|nr:hypothetical protein CALCODRAFT_559071 [Calocera cornea HHB12733]